MNLKELPKKTTDFLGKIDWEHYNFKIMSKIRTYKFRNAKRIKQKIIFLHIPKCAGQSVRSYINDYANTLGLKKVHLICDHVCKERNIPKNLIPALQKAEYIYAYCPFEWLINEKIDLDNYFIFTFLRDPKSRIISYYKYLHGFKKKKKRKCSRMEKDGVAFLKRVEKMTLDEFILSEDMHIKSSIDNYITRQVGGNLADYPLSEVEMKGLLSKAKKNLGKIDFIGHVEKFDEHFRILLNKLDIPYIHTPKRNKSINSESAVIISPDAEKMLKRYCKYDSELLKYALDPKKAT